jgi:hypothetical protein
MLPPFLLSLISAQTGNFHEYDTFLLLGCRFKEVADCSEQLFGNFRLKTGGGGADHIKEIYCN